MTSAYDSWLPQSGAAIDAQTVTGFGNPQAELAAADAGSVVVPLTHLGLIRASGEDAAGFLHNLFSNDVKGLAADAARLNSFCTAKGRMLASFLMWRDGGEFFLQLSADIAAAIQKKLGMYVLRSKVQLADAAPLYAQFGLAGAAAEAALAAAGFAVPAAPMSSSHAAGGTAVRIDASRFVLAVPADAAAATFAALKGAGLTPAGTAAWRLLDIRAGWPLITASVQEEFVPQMANFELLGGVSFNKGCYPGQEIVARTQYLGKLKKRMYRAVVSADAVPAPGTDLYSPDVGEQSCGKVVSATATPDGAVELLAVMQMSSFEGNDVHLGSPAGPQLAFRTVPYTVS